MLRRLRPVNPRFLREKEESPPHEGVSQDLQFPQISNFLYQVLRWITVVTVVAMLVLMLVEVVRRYLFDKTFLWSDEIIRYLLLYCTFLGGACAYYQKGLVAFTLIFDKLNKKTQAILMLVTNIICLVFFAFLLRYSILKVTSPSVVKSVSTASGLSLSVLYASVPIGLFFLLVFTIDFFPELIRNIRDAGKPEAKKEGSDA